MFDKNRSAVEIDLRAYWLLLRKRRLLVTAITIGIAIVATAWTLQQPKIYEATATVVIDPQAPKVLGQQTPDVVELGSSNYWTSEEYYNTQQRILRSKSLSEEVVRTFKLAENRKIVPDPATPPEEALVLARDYVRNGVRVLPVKSSRVFGIAFRDRDPELAAELANDVAAVYIQQNLAGKTDVTSKAKRWVAEQLDDARRKLDASEQALYKYKQENNVLSIDLKEQQNQVTKDLDQFARALSDTKRRRIDLQTRRRAIAGLLASDALRLPSTHIMESPTIGRLREAYLEEERKLADMQGMYGDKHPLLQNQERRVEAARAAVKSEGETVLKAVDAELSALVDAEGRFQAEVKRLTDEALALNQKEIEYKRLDRDQRNAADVYAMLSKRLSESGLQAEDTANNIHPLDRAEPSYVPVEPRLKQAIVLGLLAGLVMALALVSVLELLDRTIKNHDDVESMTGFTFLGLIPAVKEMTKAGVRELHVIKHPNSQVAECCRVLRTNILFCSPDKPLKRLLVTSSNAVDGKTMTVVNLGVVMAQGGHRTLLVDTDLRRPRLHKVLGVPNDNGVSRLIVGEAKLDDAVKTTDVPNLFVLPCGPLPPNPAELLQTEKFTQLAELLSEKFDRVIFDSPPVLAVTDAPILSRMADGVIVVARAGSTTRDALMRLKRHLDAVSAKVTGVVLNDVDLTSPTYGGSYYGYQNHYYNNAAPAPAAGEPPKT